MEIRKMWQKIKCFLGFHPIFACEKVEVFKGSAAIFSDDWYSYESRVDVDPFSRWTTIENKYKCALCGGTFWYAPLSYEKLKVDEYIFQSVKQLAKDRKYDEVMKIIS